MKKFLYSSIIALAGLFAVSSCETVNEKVIYDHNTTVAPTMGEYAGAELAVDGPAIELTFEAADFNHDWATGTELYLSLTEDFAQPTKISAAIADGKATIQQSSLNGILLNLGATPGQGITVYFRLLSYLVNEKNTPIESSYTYSNIITCVFTPYEPPKADTSKPEKDSYGHIFVVGSYNGWSHNDSVQYLFNYKGDETVYSGIVDFGEEHSANEFKLTAGDWGVGEHSMAGAHEAEAATIALVAGGGDNINVYQAKRYYHLTFDKSAPSLSTEFSFEKVGIIGLNGDWENDIVMEYNPVFVRFYADIDAPAATEMKFRVDSDWTLNWGVDMEVNGGNIPVEAGQYRVYLDLNKMAFTIDASMFGKDEPTSAGSGDTPDTPVEPEDPSVPTPSEFGIYVIDESGWDAIAMYTWGEGAVQDGFGGWPGIQLTEKKSYAGKEWYYVNIPSTLVGGTANIIFNNNNNGTQHPDYVAVLDKDIFLKVTATGVEDAAPKSEYGIYVIDETGWDAIALYSWGEGGAQDGFGGWPGVVLTETKEVEGVTYLYTEIPVAAIGCSANLIFNNNNNGTQLPDYTVVLDHDIFVKVTAAGVENLGAAEPEPEEPAEKVWHMVGAFNGWKAQDDAYKMTKEGDFYVFKNFTLTADSAMKFAVGNWAEERGGSGSFTANAALPLLGKDGGKDIKVPAGKYDVYLDDVNNKGYFMTDGKTPADAVEVTVQPYDLSKIVCGLAGEFSGAAHWDNPPTGERVAAFVSAEGNVATYKLANFALKAGDKMKLILDGAWCGGTVNADYSISIEYNAGADIVVPEGISGNYDVMISFKYELVDSKHTFSEIKIQIAQAA